MKTRVLTIPAMIVIAVSPYQDAFGCVVDIGNKVFLPWHEILYADCTVTGYTISLAGIIYSILGALAIAFWATRRRKIK